jgi:hypothetical protein
MVVAALAGISIPAYLKRIAAAAERVADALEARAQNSVDEDRRL